MYILYEKIINKNICSHVYEELNMVPRCVVIRVTLNFYIIQFSSKLWYYLGRKFIFFNDSVSELLYLNTSCKTHGSRHMILTVQKYPSFTPKTRTNTYKRPATLTISTLRSEVTDKRERREKGDPGHFEIDIVERSLSSVHKSYIKKIIKQ